MGERFHKFQVIIAFFFLVIVLVLAFKYFGSFYYYFQAIPFMLSKIIMFLLHVAVYHLLSILQLIEH